LRKWIPKFALKLVWGLVNCRLLVCYSFLTEIESKYDKKMKALREELELRRKTEIHEIEEVFDF